MKNSLQVWGFFFFYHKEQAEKGYADFKLEKHGLNMLIAGPILFVYGLIYTIHVLVACGHLQITFLIWSLLVIASVICNSCEQAELILLELGIYPLTLVNINYFTSISTINTKMSTFIKYLYFNTWKSRCKSKTKEHK